jgi:hypothetical protein
LTKTFCDRCGGECQNYTASLYGNITHTTGKGEIVAEESIEQIQFCHACLDAAAAALGLTIRASHYGMEDRPVMDAELRSHP